VLRDAETVPAYLTRRPRTPHQNDILDSWSTRYGFGPCHPPIRARSRLGTKDTASPFTPPKPNIIHCYFFLNYSEKYPKTLSKSQHFSRKWDMLLFYRRCGLRRQYHSFSPYTYASHPCRHNDPGNRHCKESAQNSPQRSPYH